MSKRTGVGKSDGPTEPAQSLCRGIYPTAQNDGRSIASKLTDDPSNFAPPHSTGRQPTWVPGTYFSFAPPPPVPVLPSRYGVRLALIIVNAFSFRSRPSCHDPERA